MVTHSVEYEYIKALACDLEPGDFYLGRVNESCLLDNGSARKITKIEYGDESPDLDDDDIRITVEPPFEKWVPGPHWWNRGSLLRYDSTILNTDDVVRVKATVRRRREPPS